MSHRFALVRLPYQFLEGDPLPISPTDRWFETRDQAVKALPELLDREDDGAAPAS